MAALRADENRKQEEEARAAIAKAGPALAGTSVDPVAGNPQGEVTLVEFYDLHCPYCRRRRCQIGGAGRVVAACPP